MDDEEILLPPDDEYIDWLRAELYELERKMTPDRYERLLNRLTALVQAASDAFKNQN